MISKTAHDGEIIAVIRNDRQRVFGIGCMVLVGGFLVAGVVGNSSLGRVSDQLGYYVTTALLAWGIWRVVNTRLVVTSRGLTVVNWVRTYEVPWGALHAIETDDDLRLVLSNGEVIRPGVGAGSLVAVAHGSPAQRELQERIKAFRVAAKPEVGNAARHIDVGARIAGPILLLGAAATVLLTLFRS